MDGEVRQPIEQVFTELTGLHLFTQLVMGGGHHAHVNLVRCVAAQRPQFTLLQYAQKLGLQQQWHVADFIQKQGAAVGGVE